MASTLLQSRPGTVHLISPPTGVTIGTLLTWKDGGPGNKNNSERTASPIVINNVGYSQGLNVQFMSTLKKFVYVYSFGDRIGELRIGGLAFDNNDCNTGDSGWGARSVFAYYRDHRAIRDNQKVSVVFAGEAITGFLVGLDMSLTDAQFKTMSFSLTIKTLPKDAIKPRLSSSDRARARQLRLVKGSDREGKSESLRNLFVNRIPNIPGKSYSSNTGDNSLAREYDGIIDNVIANNLAYQGKSTGGGTLSNPGTTQLREINPRTGEGYYDSTYKAPPANITPNTNIDIGILDLEVQKEINKQ